jgi:formylglycine-generating enzyme required for sulfatase activity
MVLVPAGEFRFGAMKQVASLPAFYIDKTEVSNAAYAQFCQATKHPLPEGFPSNQPAYPVVNVTIGDAREFAHWGGKRLPTDWEWEKAARGSDGRTFPWGAEMDVSRAHVLLTGQNPTGQQLRPVDGFPLGASPYGALQMIGNAWELVDKQRGAPADLSPFQTLKPPLQPGETWYMIRGESAWEHLDNSAIWDSSAVPERWKDMHVGFRCVKDPK